LGHFAKCAAKVQKFPKVTKYFLEIRSKKVTLSSFFAFWGLAIRENKGAFFFAKREIEKQKHRQVGTPRVVWSGVN